MKNIFRGICITLLAALMLQNEANAKPTECKYTLANVNTTARVIEETGAALTFKVNGTASVTYTHKDGTSSTGLVNLDQGVNIVVGVSEPMPYHDTAKEKGKIPSGTASRRKIGRTVQKSTMQRQ